MIPYMVGKLASNPTYSTRGLVKYVPGRDYFRAVYSQNGDKFVISPSPSIVERVYTLRVTFVTAGGVRYRTASGRGKYIGYELRIETGTERTTIIVDIFNIIQNV